MENVGKKKGKRTSEQSNKAKKRKQEEPETTEKENKPEEELKSEAEPKERPKKSHKKRQKGLYKRIAEQLEFYFSDANLRRSKHMMQLLEKDPWVPLSEFRKFNKILSLVSDLTADRELEDHLLKALQVKNSDMLEVSEDLSKVKRTTALEKKKDTESCTIYVENIPPDSTHDSLKYNFKQYGDVVYISIPKFIKSEKLKGFAFIEFTSPASVSAVMSACGGSLDADAPNNRGEDLASIRTFQQQEMSQTDKNNKEEDTENKGDSSSTENQTSGESKKDAVKVDCPPSPKRMKLEEATQEKQSENQIEMGNLHGLTILTKQQWRRLRNQYLNQQRKNISTAKRHIKTGGMNTQNNFQQQQQQQQQQNNSTAKQEQAKFEKGLIVKVVTTEQTDNVKTVKQKVRQLNPDVCYIDVKVGQTQFYVRCRSQEEALNITHNKVEGWTMSQLKGEEESDYHKVIEQDMADKKSGKVTVPKKNKKSRLLDKLEQHTNSHMYFPD